MDRSASEGLILATEKKGEVTIVEINSETDFVAKNKDFINFCKEISELNFECKGDLEKLKKLKMKNSSTVEENLINLISKIGEKITIRRSKYFDNKRGSNFFYVHSSLEKDIGKIISVVKLSVENKKLGQMIAMHIAASNPLAIKKEGIEKNLVDKELEIIKAELINSGKTGELAEKISKGKINKYISDNALLDQIWIMDPKKVSDVLKENKTDKEIQVLDFVRYKVGEGI